MSKNSQHVDNLKISLKVAKKSVDKLLISCSQTVDNSVDNFYPEKSKNVFTKINLMV